MGAGARGAEATQNYFITLASSAGSSRKSRPSARAAAKHARNKHWVFVYGTLKRGFANESLLSGATYIGHFKTLVPYPLVVGGAYFCPYLLDIPGKGSRVKGEVYAVSDSTLAALDRFENVGTNFTRKVIKVASCSDRSFDAKVFVYLKCNYTNDLLVQRYINDYQCRKYVPRNLRPAVSVARSAKNDPGSSMYNGKYASGRR